MIIIMRSEIWNVIDNHCQQKIQMTTMAKKKEKKVFTPPWEVCYVLLYYNTELK